jgi:hypothetical protein
LGSWRPDLTAYRDLESAYRIGLKSLARRYLELHDEIADLDAMAVTSTASTILSAAIRRSTSSARFSSKGGQRKIENALHKCRASPASSIAAIVGTRFEIVTRSVSTRRRASAGWKSIRTFRTPNSTPADIQAKHDATKNGEYGQDDVVRGHVEGFEHRPDKRIVVLRQNVCLG